MATVDLAIVNVAAPTIQRNLHASGADLQLIVSGYTIAYAMSLISGSRLGDQLGHARAFRLGLLGFAVASLACGLAGSSLELVTFRFIQGLSAGVMIPQVMSLIQRNFSGRERARAIGYYGAVGALGYVFGQVAGGALVSANIFGASWRPIFLINVPIGVAMLVLAGRHVPSDGGEPGRGFDSLGVITSSAAVLALVLPLVLGHDDGWPTWCWISFALSAGFFGAFVAVERRQSTSGHSPVVSGHLLHIRGLVLGSSTVFLAVSANNGMLFGLALYLQESLHLTASHTGLFFAVMATGSGIGALNWSRLPTSWHRWLVPGGMFGDAVAYFCLGTIEHSGSLKSGLLAVDLLAVGLCFGISFGPVITMTLHQVPSADAADASGVFVTMMTLGQVIGVAALGTLYLSFASHHESTNAITFTCYVAAGCTVLAVLVGVAQARGYMEETSAMVARY